MTNDIYIDESRYEIVQLPSKGECYRNKVKELPVGYLTALDENIITSPQLLENGTMCDVLLEKKILYKTFNVEDLCIADRKAILLWLRRTGYGDTYSYIDESGEEKEIDLSVIVFKDFTLKGDEQGHFEYVLPNGDIIKYRILTHRDETEISKLVEQLDNEIISGKNMSETEYYCKVAQYILQHHVVSVNGASNIDEWLNGLSYEDLKQLIEYLRGEVPGTKIEIGIKLNEELFYDMFASESKYLTQR